MIKMILINIIGIILLVGCSKSNINEGKQEIDEEVRSGESIIENNDGLLQLNAKESDNEYIVINEKTNRMYALLSSSIEDNNDGTYTIYGEIVVPYIWSIDEFSKITKDGTLTLFDGEKYNIAKNENDYSINNPTLKICKTYNGDYYYISSSFGKDADYYNMGMKGKITVSSETPVDLEYSEYTTLKDIMKDPLYHSFFAPNDADYRYIIRVNFEKDKCSSLIFLW